jgi:hypothetical protein
MRNSSQCTVLRSMAVVRFMLDEIQAVKQMVAQVGAERVQQLAGYCGREL